MTPRNSATERVVLHAVFLGELDRTTAELVARDPSLKKLSALAHTVPPALREHFWQGARLFLTTLADSASERAAARAMFDYLTKNDALPKQMTWEMLLADLARSGSV